ncbi:MAG: NAD(P)/FAD-dependent oxidoreductase [Gammaproteobacteria bacterium]|nr:NAD(P)/FAD-dependent oxidoreductase [Gammaproteobacteria bacterium]
MTLDAVIIGAGFAGLYQLYCLREQLGFSVQVLEAGSGVGGTWYWNRYPGARCDSESQVYCYSWSEELTQEWNWTERYPGPDEISAYLNHVTDKFDLRRSINFDSSVVSARFLEENNHWEIRTDSGTTYTARFLITAVGCLSTANIPDIAGLEDFQGEWYHTGRWPREEVSFVGKRVIQIGTGSTGIQAAPVIAETAGHLTVMQRTANYSVPARNRLLTDQDHQQHKAQAKARRQLTRSNSNGHPWRISEQNAEDTSVAERDQRYADAWADGGLKFRAAFADLLTSNAANRTAADFIAAKIRAKVHDPDTAATLTRFDHPYAAKRPPIDTNYFETFNRPNVSLVDLRNTPINKITATGIDTTDQHIEADMIVFATGFDAMTGTLLKINIEGRDNKTLADAWRAGPRNYLGIQVDGFPNLFTLTGPGSPSVLTNMPVAIEQHVEWTTECLRFLQQQNLERIECTREAVDSWVENVNKEADATLMPTVKHSWYLGANVPGKPRVFMPYVGGLDKFRKLCDAVAEDHYRGFTFN